MRFEFEIYHKQLIQATNFFFWDNWPVCLCDTLLLVYLPVATDDMCTQCVLHTVILSQIIEILFMERQQISGKKEYLVQ